MVRFRFGDDHHDDDDDDDDEDDGTTPHETAIVEAHENAVKNDDPIVNYEESPAEPPAYVVAYQRDGTPVLVPFPVHPHQSRRQISWTFWIVLVAVLIQVVRWYGPPAPPSADETWNQFLDREAGALLKAATALLSVVPHVSHWCWKSIHADVTDLLQPPPCPLKLPNDYTAIEESLVGQSRAVAVTTQALQAWDKSKALIVVLSGTVGLGKLKLALQMASSVACADAILRLHGREFSHKQDLLAQIQQHTARGDSVVIIEHPEEMASLVLNEALQALSSTPNLLLLMTTHAGSRVIHRHLKLEEEPSSSSLDWSLRHEIEEQLQVNLSDRLVAVIAPFVPLGAEELQTILIDKVSQLPYDHLYKSLEMTEELAEAWTSANHVEYLEWTSQGKNVLTFSSRGAKILDEEIRLRLVSQLKLGLGAAPVPERAVQLDWDSEEEEAVFQTCEEDKSEQGQLLCEELWRFRLTAY